MDIAGVHYDLTDLCNAGCPQCARTNPLGCKANDWLVRKACSLEDFKRFSPTYFLEKLNYAYFCGNLGDPAAVPELIPILQYCWDANPDLKLRLFSNGSLRNPDWWRDLASTAAGRRFVVVAAIDGATPETSSRYRVGIDFRRILRNLAAFIDTGGNAEWRMILFRHNEDEVEAARQLAKAMGFSSFRSYPSSRFGAKDSLTYIYKGEPFTLERTKSKQSPKSATVLTIAPKGLRTTKSLIKCESLRTSEIFIDFLGYLSPCCYVSLPLFQHVRGRPRGGYDRSIGEVFDAFDPMQLNVNSVGFDQALANLERFFDFLRERWSDEQPFLCKRVCGKEIKPMSDKLLPDPT